MKSRISLHALLSRAGAVSLLLAGPLAAQEATLESLVDGSRQAMDRQQWEQALDLSNEAVTRFGAAQPMRRYGPQFGVIFYRKGLCEMKLKRWKEAMASFETCYRDFPNGATAKDGGNTYQKLALLKWAEAAMGADEWELALARFAKFIDERDKLRDKFPQGSYHVNLAICHYQLGHIAQGSENLEIAIRNRTNFPTPDVGIIAGFQALVVAVIQERNEQALLDFIAKNRGGLIIDPSEMVPFSPVFLKLAGDAITADMRRAALEIYQFVPSTDVVIDDLRARLKAMGGAVELKDRDAILVRKVLEERLEACETERRGKRSMETIKLAGVAFLQEAAGNLTGAFAAYQQLEIFHAAAEKREDNLFNLIRVAGRVGLGAELRKHAAAFLKDFPDSGRNAEIRGFILSSLEGEDDMAARIAVAGPMLDSLVKGSPERDLCLFILGVSYFNTGAYDKAFEMLDQHMADHPDSIHTAQAAYYQAASAARLGLREKSDALFDAILAGKSDSPWLAPALYDRAAADFEAKRPDAALLKIQRLTAEFPRSTAMARALILLGDVQSALGRALEAEKAYQDALASAVELGDRGAAGETLCRLVELLGKAGSPEKGLKTAVSHADRYWKEYAADSPLQARVAVAQVRAFLRTGRGDEALERLKLVIAAGGGDPAGIGALIDAYAEAFPTNRGPEELEKQLAGLPGLDPANHALQARLRLAVIGAYEKEARETKDDTRRTAIGSMVKALYQKIKTDSAPADLDTVTLIRLADHLRTATSTPREALVYYDAVIARNAGPFRTAALLGRGDVRSRSPGPGEIDLAIADFTEASGTTDVAGERGYASFRIVESLMAKEDFAKAAERAAAYQNAGASGPLEFAPQVSLMLARSYQELKRNDEAIAEYARLWSTRVEDVLISAPAMIGWMRLVGARNREAGDDGTLSDRQTAYEGGARYLERTRQAAASLKEEDLGPWREIEQSVRNFTNSPGIKPLPTDPDHDGTPQIKPPRP